MKVLIGTPIHESKDYSMNEWIFSISKIEHPFDLLMVDNSPNPEYVKKVDGYCKKYGLTNYKIVHLDFDKDEILDEKLAQSREIIRREVLDKNYDAWFSLECDVIAPKDALSKLIDLIGDNWMVSHVYPARDNQNNFNSEFGITLIKKEALKKYDFIKQYGYVNFLKPSSWYGNDVWFIKRMDRDGEGKHINVGGIIRPIYHLAK